MHIVAWREPGYLCKKSSSYDDTRGNRYDRQGMRGEQLLSGSSTYDLKPVYIFSIDSFSRLHGTDWGEDRIVSTYSIREDECLELLTGNPRFVFVELDRFRKKKWEDLDNDRERYYFCLKHLHELKERMLSPSVWDAGRNQETIHKRYGN